MTLPALLTDLSRTERAIRCAFFGAVVLASALALSKHHADPDLWGHVQYGRDLLQHGLPAMSTYSYTSVGYPWVNHELVSEILLAAGMDVVGPAGLLIIKCLLGAALIVGILWRAQSAGVSELVAAATVLLVAVNLMHFWSLRPQLMTFLCTAAMALILDKGFTRWPAERCKLNWLSLLVPLFALWANSHGGFVAGYSILLAFIAGRSGEALWRLRAAALQPLAAIYAIVAVAGAATLLNPYGWGLHRWLSHSLGSPRPEIVEWLPPEWNFIWAPFWILAVVFVASTIFTRERRDLTHVLVLSIMLWQATEHRRHIAFFAIFFGFWMSVHVQSVWDRLFTKPSESDAGKMSLWQARALLGGLIAMCAVLAVNLRSQLQELPVRRDGYPVAAFQYMADHQLQGRLVARFKWAQYAIAACGARTESDRGSRRAFDGRFRTCYPQSVIDMYFDFAVGAGTAETRYRAATSPPVLPERILEHEKPDLVLIGREQLHAVEVMQRSSENWVLLYQDSVAQLWGRKHRYGIHTSTDFVPPAERRISDREQRGIVPWPALPQYPPARDSVPGAGTSSIQVTST